MNTRNYFMLIQFLVYSATTAIAADFPSRETVDTPSTPLTTWTGIYAGMNAGSNWKNSSNLNYATYSLTPDNTPSVIDAALLTGNTGNIAGKLGFIGGGQIGYNWRAYQNFVIGAEADIQGIAGSSGNNSRWTAGNDAGFSNEITGIGPGAFSSTALSNQHVKGSLNWLGTVRGRIGYLVMPNLLVYGTGGLAYSEFSSSVSNTQIFNGSGTGYASFAHGIFRVTYGQESVATILKGYSVGGGLEWLFMQNWSAKAEYVYYNMGNTSSSVANIAYPINFSTGAPFYATTSIASITNYRTNIGGNIIRVGINYHYNWGSAPIIAQY